MSSHCRACGDPLPAAARFCRSCGAPVVAEPTASPPVAAASPRRSWRPALAVGAVLAVGAAGAAAAVALSGGDDGAKDGAEQVDPPTSTLSGSSNPPPLNGATSTPTADVTSAPTPTATATPLSVDGMTAGRYLRLGSFRTTSRATTEAARLRRAGIDTQVVSSDEVLGMVPAFQVLVAGPLPNRSRERTAIRSARRSGISDAFVKDFSANPLPVAADDLAGAYRGSLSQVNPSVKRLNHEIPMTVEITDDGRSGAIEYRRPHCESTLSLRGRHAAAISYDESVTQGRCVSGGVWHFKREGETLRATWWRDDDLTFVLGALTATS